MVIIYGYLVDAVESTSYIELYRSMYVVMSKEKIRGERGTEEDLEK
jgi:hypothetical protein